MPLLSRSAGRHQMAFNNAFCVNTRTFTFNKRSEFSFREDTSWIVEPQFNGNFEATEISTPAQNISKRDDPPNVGIDPHPPKTLLTFEHNGA